jgi:heme exporter protein D
MNQGVIVGGWEYVWAAYGLTAAAFLTYGITLMWNLRQELRRR